MSTEKKMNLLAPFNDSNFPLKKSLVKKKLENDSKVDDGAAHAIYRLSAN